MLFHVTWEFIDTRDESERQGLAMFGKWQPPAGGDFKGFYGFVDGTGGVAIVEADSASKIARHCGRGRRDGPRVGDRGTDRVQRLATGRGSRAAERGGDGPGPKRARCPVAADSVQEGNEDATAFRRTSRYVVVTATRP
jgi:Protein of unknown function (DUF3303)